VARLAVHQNQRKVRVSLQHENSQELAQAIAHVSNTLQRFWFIAEQWSVQQRWTLLLSHIFRHWLSFCRQWDLAQFTCQRQLE
jgi:hypothetical protein